MKVSAVRESNMSLYMQVNSELTTYGSLNVY